MDFDTVDIAPLDIVHVEKYQKFLNFGQVEDNGSAGYAFLMCDLTKWKRSWQRPFSNSKYLHELEEIKMIGEMGFDPFSKDVGEFFRAHPEINVSGLMVEHSYLQHVLAKQGVEISLGVVVALNPTYPLEIQTKNKDILNGDGALQLVESEIPHTKEALEVLIREEPYLLEDYDQYDPKIKWESRKS